MRALFLVALVAVLASACTVEPTASAVAEADRSATIGEIADPTNDLELEDLDRVDLEGRGQLVDNFCDAFAAVGLLSIESAVVPLQHVIDAWEMVDEVPEAAADDVTAMMALADLRLEWHFGRVDTRPDIDLVMAEGLERIADYAARNCDLPLVIGFAVDISGWTATDRQQRCQESEDGLTEGIALYRDLRGADPMHSQQIELAAWTELLRGDPDVPFWLASSHHGIGVDGNVVATGACN